jgi:hypothetical protein
MKELKQKQSFFKMKNKFFVGFFGIYERQIILMETFTNEAKIGGKNTVMDGR